MNQTDAQRAYNQIKEWIVTTEMLPGAVIQEAEVMERLGLGRTPVREALKTLEAERLVVVSPRRGMFVSEVSITDLQHVQEIRYELDSLCARLAVERITPAELMQLRETVALADSLRGQPDRQQELLDADRRFHFLLAAATHNPIIRDEFDKLYNLSLRIWYLFVNQITPDDLAQDELGSVLEAIEERNVNLADRAMRKHILQFSEAIRRYI